MGRFLYIFCSDEKTDQAHLQRACKHLGPVAARHGLTLFHPGLLRTGDPRSLCADRAAATEVAVVLLSVDFLQEGCQARALFEDHVAPAHLQGRVLATPVLLRQTGLSYTHFEERVVRCGDRPLDSLSPDAREAVWSAVAEEIDLALNASPPPAASDAAPDADPEELRRFEELVQLRLPRHEEAMRCDRTRQWEAFEGTAHHPSHRILLLSGGMRQGHNFFLVRARLCLRPHPREPHPTCVSLPNCRILVNSENAYRAAFTQALGGRDERDLPHLLKERLKRANLILFHEPHHDGDPLADAGVFECLTQWLPRLLTSEVGPTPYGLKCLQPVVWAECGPLSYRLAALIGLPPSAAQRARLTRLCRRIERHAHPDVPVLPLDPLPPIERDDVLRYGREVLGQHGAPLDRFVKEAMGADSSSDHIIRFIVKNYDRYRLSRRPAP